jgi:hypothetical protein
MRATTYCRRGCLPTSHRRRAAALPRIASHCQPTVAATAPLPTASTLPQPATHTPRRPFRTDLATAPAPPSSLSPASKGSTAAGLADALPSPASRAARRRQVHPLQVRGRHPRQFTREANGIPQGGGFLDLLPLSCPSPLPRGAHQRSARQFTRRLTRGVHRSLFPESTSVHVDCPGASTS